MAVLFQKEKAEMSRFLTSNNSYGRQPTQANNTICIIMQTKKRDFTIAKCKMKAQQELEIENAVTI